MQSAELENAINAIQSIRTQSDLNVLAQTWRDQQTFLATTIGRRLKKGDTIEWEDRNGNLIPGTILKLNKKTCEVVRPGGTPFGRTVTKIYNSMIVRKVKV
tara:strand:+ start:866 stop:1168 length:303 start_codon:yes stop_codon:yes gene_type:complete